MFLVFIRSYRDSTLSIDDLKQYGKLFKDWGSASQYCSELEELCSGWLVIETIELPEPE